MSIPNIVGAGSACALRHLLLLVRSNNPMILILVETRTSSSFIGNILSRTHFNDSIVSEAAGFADGIWILWDNTQLNLEMISIDDQFINVLVRGPHQALWLLSVVYASPNPVFRVDLWQYLSLLGTVVQFPWLLIGDFNKVLVRTEKKGGIPVSFRRIQPFQDMASHCSLVDLRFSGPSFT